MKLAVINPDGLAQCLLCDWKEKPPQFHSIYVDSKRKKEELPKCKKVKLAEQAVVAHLRDLHARVMLTREEKAGEEGIKLEYHGRAEVRCWGALRRF